jgi:hypothetical protein
MRSNVDLPEPFGPTTPTRSPSAIATERSVKSGAAPKALLMPWTERMTGALIKLALAV